MSKNTKAKTKDPKQIFKQRDDLEDECILRRIKRPDVKDFICAEHLKYFDVLHLYHKKTEMENFLCTGQHLINHMAKYFVLDTKVNRALAVALRDLLVALKGKEVLSLRLHKYIEFLDHIMESTTTRLVDCRPRNTTFDAFLAQRHCEINPDKPLCMAAVVSLRDGAVPSTPGNDDSLFQVPAPRAAPKDKPLKVHPVLFKAFVNPVKRLEGAYRKEVPTGDDVVLESLTHREYDVMKYLASRFRVTGMDVVLTSSRFSELIRIIRIATGLMDMAPAIWKKATLLIDKKQSEQPGLLDLDDFGKNVALAFGDDGVTRDGEIYIHGTVQLVCGQIARALAELADPNHFADPGIVEEAFHFGYSYSKVTRFLIDRFVYTDKTPELFADPKTAFDTLRKFSIDEKDMPLLKELARKRKENPNVEIPEARKRKELPIETEMQGMAIEIAPKNAMATLLTKFDAEEQILHVQFVAGIEKIRNEYKTKGEAQREEFDKKCEDLKREFEAVEAERQRNYDNEAKKCKDKFETARNQVHERRKSEILQLYGDK